MTTYTWRTITSYSGKQEAITYGRKLQKEGYHIRVKSENNMWKVQSDDYHRKVYG